MNEQELRARSLDQLKWSLQALALPPDKQLGLFPPFTCTADEMALDFDHWAETARSQHAFAADQLSALAAVDDLLSEMTGENNAELWTDAALTQLLRWQEVRERARTALRIFGWHLDMPPSDRATFIQ